MLQYLVWRLDVPIPPLIKILLELGLASDHALLLSLDRRWQ
jgi:hypothetical protein